MNENHYYNLLMHLNLHFLKLFADRMDEMAVNLLNHIPCH